MLSELHIENLAVIPSASITLKPGLNVITGETGAGKTILAHAITLLLGNRADSGLIRPGAQEASVEAVFSLPEGFFAGLAHRIEVPDSGQLIVRRRLSRDGRSRAYVGGRGVNLSVLEELTGSCLKFSAQHEQRRLMMASHQLEIIDDYGGAELLDLRDEYRLVYERRVEMLAALEQVGQDSEAAQREAELLKFQIAEIEAAGIVSGEDEDLQREKDRLGRLMELKGVAGALAVVLGSDGGEGGLMDALAAAGARLEDVAGVDPELDSLAERLQTNFFELEDLARGARDFAGSLDLDPARLLEVEERLELLGQMKRKYGASLDEVLAYASRSSTLLASLSGSQADRSELEKELSAAEEEAIQLARRLRDIRLEAAGRLEQAAAVQLKDLAFENSGFEVRLSGTNGNGAEDEITAAGLSRSGADAVEFYVGLNPGMPATPIRETASGGELSRIMLAIKSAAPAREDATLVFDEIDAGIGGETGSAVGAKLRKLASGSQIICITHLPQIACYADAHFSVSKSASGGKTVTRVNRLGELEAVDELCRMMGSRPEDDKARAHAASLLKKAGAGAEGEKATKKQAGSSHKTG